MNTIWKFSFKIADRVMLPMPSGARILEVGQPINPEEGDLCIWALVEPDAPKATRALRIFGTGHDIDPIDARLLHHIGSVTTGLFVWHVFDEGLA